MSGVEAVLNTLTGVDRGRSQAWMDKALCQGDKEDIWFPEPPSGGGPAPVTPDGQIVGYGPHARYLRKVAFAVSICQECPVRAQCLADAESRNERHGIWGGKDFYRPRAHSQQPRRKAS